MKVFLVQNAQLGQVLAPERRGADNQRIVSFLVAVTPSSIRPVNEADPEEVQLCNSLRRQLESEGDSAGLLHCEITTENDVIATWFRVLSCPLTSALVELLGETARVQVAVSYWNIKELPDFPSGSFKTSEMKIKNGPYACEDPNFYQDICPDFRLVSLLRGGAATLTFEGLLTVTISGDMPSGPVVTDKMQVNRKMLLEELGSDVVILAGNGKEVKAHTGMLSAHSDVFKAMFQSDMKEAMTHTVEMPDFCEEGVRALLAYLYCWEETEPNSKPNVALEMLQAGHKYDIPVLETAMRKLLLAKPMDWFDGDVALKLFLFAKKLPDGGERLKMKAIKIMKMNFENFKKSPTYVNLFEEDPKTAMEICSYFAA